MFDLSAAFPSVSRYFLFAAPPFLGFPASALRVVRALYTDSTCEVKVGGVRVLGFRLESGVRQVCPLSPLHYVVALDGLLRRLSAAVPASMPWAYADDTTVMVPDLPRDAVRLQHVFMELEAASALRLHLRRTVVPPLGRRPAMR